MLLAAFGSTTSPQPLTDAAALLAHYGIEAETTLRDLLVAGACGRSRSRKPIFGGVTRTLPGEARLPWPMAH